MHDSMVGGLCYEWASARASSLEPMLAYPTAVQTVADVHETPFM